MGISRVSRYYDGPIAQLPNVIDPTTYDISVYRNWPTSVTVRWKWYIFKDGDNLSSIAAANPYLANPKYWWEILDLNPEISDPWSIEPGTPIRIPYGN